MRPFLISLCVLAACNSTTRSLSPAPAGQGGTGASGGSGPPSAGSGGAGGTASLSPDLGAPQPGLDAAEADAPTTSDAAADAPMSLLPDAAGNDHYPDSAFLTGRPDIRLCEKEWTADQCCAFLCSCLGTICADSAKAKPGLADCMSWCPKLSNMLIRCHVYHCYISVSPTGGINDHDSHCGHAANQVQGGACPPEVYQ